jgi:hypothetical protein
MNNGFYRKSKPNVLNYIDNSFKVIMNFNMVKNGANINEVFKINPCGLDAFITKTTIIANKPLKGKITQTNISTPRVRFMPY